jgi:hypothetical protein
MARGPCRAHRPAAFAAGFLFCPVLSSSSPRPIHAETQSPPSIRQIVTIQTRRPSELVFVCSFPTLALPWPGGPWVHHQSPAAAVALRRPATRGQGRGRRVGKRQPARRALARPRPRRQERTDHATGRRDGAPSSPNQPRCHFLSGRHTPTPHHRPSSALLSLRRTWALNSGRSVWFVLCHNAHLIAAWYLLT